MKNSEIAMLLPTPIYMRHYVMSYHWMGGAIWHYQALLNFSTKIFPKLNNQGLQSANMVLFQIFPGQNCCVSQAFFHQVPGLSQGGLAKSVIFQRFL